MYLFYVNRGKLRKNNNLSMFYPQPLKNINKLENLHSISFDSTAKNDYTVKTALVKIQIICLYKEVIIPSGIKVI